MKTIVPVLAALLFSQLALGGSSDPAMTRIVTRYLSPKIQPDSFAAKPKTLYIAGTSYSRSEEEPDSAQGIHALIVVSEPNVWMINLLDHTGRHIIDPGPTYIVHHNILDREAPKEFAALEFGKEVAFFRAHKTGSLPAREIDHVRCSASEFQQQPYRVVLCTRSDTGAPWQLDVYKDGEADFGVRYLSYETGLPFKPALFRPPSGITMTEESQKKEATPRHPDAEPAATSPGGDLEKFGDLMSYFYLDPSPDNFRHLQAEADRVAGSLSKSNNADLLAAVVIATAADKHHWKISGRGPISRQADELREGKSQPAKYVRDDSIVNVAKLDVWWAEFFATGEAKYLAKILGRAKHPERGERAADFMVPAMAAWSFKANCGQHKAVLAFARSSLESNAFPNKKAFLQECVEFGGTHSPSR